MLQELDRLEEAQASLRQAIELKPDVALAHRNLGINLYINRDIISALESVQNAINIEPEVKINKALYAVIQANDTRGKAELSVDNDSSPVCSLGLLANPFITQMAVKPELIATLTEMQSREMNKALHSPVYGNGRCSIDYNLFDNAHPIIKTVENDLVSIIKQAVKSDIYVLSSFFNIYGAGAGIPPHTHLNEIDTEKHLHLAEQKYSLVYYLSVGDQNCSEPGILKLYDPSDDILPCEGMIVIIPAGRRHSAVYGGEKDRVIIGINFYSL